MARKNKTKTAPPKSSNNPSAVPNEPQCCVEGEDLAAFLKSIKREIESSRAVESTLPEKFWIKQQFAVGVNEVTRALERMPKDKMQTQNNSKDTCVHLQAILLASDSNPRWLMKHLPALAASRDVPLIFIKDKKVGSLRLGEMIKIKTAIAVGIMDKGNSINRVIKEVLASKRTDGVEA